MTGTAANRTQDGDSRPHGRAGTVWVVNREKGEVTVFDAKSGVVPWRHGRLEPERTRSPSRTTSARRTSPTRRRRARSRSCPHARSPGRTSHSARDRTTPSRAATGRRSSSGWWGISSPRSMRRRIRSTMYTSSSNPLATAHGPFFGDETIYVAHELGDEVTGINAEPWGHRVQRSRDPAADRGACGPTRATAVCVGTGQGEGQGDRSGSTPSWTRWPSASSRRPCCSRATGAR